MYILTLFTLLENVFTTKFCRVVFEKFDFQKLEPERNGNGTKSKELQYVHIIVIERVWSRRCDDPVT